MKSPTGVGMKQVFFAKGVVPCLVPDLSAKCFDVFADNAGAIWIPTKAIVSANTKHIDTRLRFIRLLVRSKTFDRVCLSTVDQHAGVIAKPLLEITIMRQRGRGALKNTPV
ncbi:unnamed protein product [Scytosiphon promiscuus]